MDILTKFILYLGPDDLAKARMADGLPIVLPSPAESITIKIKNGEKKQ
jgi:hypothetical protein